jgi:hypothetical protein
VDTLLSNQVALDTKMDSLLSNQVVLDTKLDSVLAMQQGGAAGPSTSAAPSATWWTT